MPKPLLLVTVARSRTVRRAAGALLAINLTITLGVLTPLIAVPVLLAGTGPIGTDGRPTAVGEWGYPLAGGYSVGRGFGWHPVAGCAYCSKDHRGFDMSQDCGATVYAAGPGTVLRAGPWGTFGNAVQVDHGGGVTTIYAHLAWNPRFVQPGMTVTAGTPLGLEGTTGTSTGCHLHFEVRIDGVAVDPEPFMAARGLPLT